MNTQKLEVQNGFLGQLIGEAQSVKVYLRNRKAPLEGVVLAYDTFTFVLVDTHNGGQARLIMKHAVDYIEPETFSLKKFMDRLQAKPEKNNIRM